MQTTAAILSILALLLGALPLIPVRSRATLILLIPKFFGNAWAPHVALVGVLGATLGLIFDSWVAVVAGTVGAALSADYVRRVTARHDDAFARAFGARWRQRLRGDVERRMFERRWSFCVPRAPAARFTRDVTFATLPNNRQLLCDIWQPPPRVAPSGTAVVYLHGSAWYLIDKDVGTRRFFQHLTAQGHVVMDVAYRLCPETDFIGMVADAKRAVAWMKAHAADYGVRAEQVVLMGGSAGAHIALLAAYTPNHPSLIPEGLGGVDTSVRAVVSYYGVLDLRAYDENARLFEPHGKLQPAAPRQPPGRFMRLLCRLLFGRALPSDRLPPLPTHRQMMTSLVGGLSEELPERFDLASPIHHVSSTSPATLILHGAHDQIVPLESAHRMYGALVEAKVPAVYIEYPCTGHAFDLIIPPLLAPAGQAALHDVEGFLACVTAQP